ncbi:MAG: sporulation protein SpoIID, partial [Cyanobium sp.]
MVLTAPVALMGALAVGVGFAAQSLLGGSPQAGDAQVLEALIAAPSPSSSPGAATAAASASGQASASTANPAGPGSPGSSAPPQRPAPDRANAADALAVPAAGPELPLEIRVALLKLSPWPRLSASGPWRLRDRDGQVLQQGAAGQAVEVDGALARTPELWLETGPAHHLQADGRAFEGRFRLLRGDGGLRVVNHLPLEG